MDQNLSAVAKKVAEVCEIAEIMGRNDSKRQVGSEALKALTKAFEHLKREKEKAVQYFARKRVEDIAALEKSIEEFTAELDDLRRNFSTHGPFTLSWKSHEALADLDVLLKKVDKLKETEQAILSEAAQLEVERYPSTELVAFEARVRGVYVVWEVAGEWESFQTDMLSNSVDGGGDEGPDSGAVIIESLDEIASRLAGVVAADKESQVDEGDEGGGGERREELTKLEIYCSLNGNINSYRRAMALIAKLKNDSLRPRHWLQVT